jgi:hypothetical protein
MAAEREFGSVGNRNIDRRGVETAFGLPPYYQRPKKCITGNLLELISG